jgi:hypothetical protein
VELDVAPFINAGDNAYTIVLVPNCAGALYAYSRSGSQPPQLVVLVGG